MRTINLSGPYYQVLENPFAGMSVDQRRQIGAELKAKATGKLQNAIQAIESLFQKYDALQLLSMLASYELTIGVGPNGIRRSRRKSEPVHQAHVEFCQAIALKQSRPDSKLPAGPDQYQTLRDSIVQMQAALPFVDFDDEVFELTGEDVAVRGLQKRVRGESALVRNWGHFSQVERMSRELFSPLNLPLEKALGFNANQVISIFKGMIRLSEVGESAHRNRLAELMKAKNNERTVRKYYEQLGKGIDEAQIFINEFKVKTLPRRSLMAMIMSHQDLFLSDCFTFTPAQISKEIGITEAVTEKVLDFFSMQFGDLKDATSSKLFLDNPVREKVIVKIGVGKYFCPLPQVFFSFILRALDKMVEAAKYNGLPKRRSEFLEDEVERIVKTRFPAANTIRNIKWKHEGVSYETDLITIIDSYAIIFEAKSGRITASALRGAPARIKKHLDEILVAPNVQSRRLAGKLTSILAGESDPNLERQLPAQFKKVKKVIRASISLEPFSVIQSHVWGLKDTGWLPQEFQPCPSIGLGDFEAMFEILEHPVQIVHYLERRAELEVELRYLGDEMDLLGLYLSTLFDLKIPPDENHFVNIYGMSKPIDDYFSSIALGIDVPRPKANISRYWRAIISQLESRQVDRWTELGSALLRFSPKDQNRMLQLAKKKEQSVHKNWQDNDHENIFIYVPPPPSEISLAMFLFKDANSQRRHEYMDAALSRGLDLGKDHIKQCIAIGRNIDRNDMAYHLIGLGI